MQGENEAYKILYETYSQQMMGICMRYIADANSAHDVLHDSFIKIFSAFGGYRYRGEGSLRAWMSRITVNTALAYLKKCKMLYFDDLPNDIAESEIDTELYTSVPADILMRIIEQLPIGCRTVFNLYMFEDMSHDQISQCLEISKGASLVRLSKSQIYFGL